MGKIRRRNRCPKCGSLNVIKWGVRAGHQRYKCKDFYAHWISENPEKKVWNDNLQDNILVKFISINETYNKAARRYESTLAVFRLTEVLQKAVLIEQKPTKPYDKNQKSFDKLLIMRYDDVKLIVGVQKSNQD